MKEGHAWIGVSGIEWVGRTAWTAEQKMAVTMREAMLLSASLLLVLLKAIKTAPPDSKAKNQAGPGRSKGRR